MLSWSSFFASPVNLFPDQGVKSVYVHLSPLYLLATPSLLIVNSWESGNLLFVDCGLAGITQEKLKPLEPFEEKLKVPFPFGHGEETPDSSYLNKI